METDEFTHIRSIRYCFFTMEEENKERYKLCEGMSVSPPTLLINSVLSSDLESYGSYGSYGGSEVYWDCSDLASLERSLMSDSASINNSLPSRSFLAAKGLHGFSGSAAGSSNNHHPHHHHRGNNGGGSLAGSLGGTSPNNDHHLGGFDATGGMSSSSSRQAFVSPRVSLTSAETFNSSTNNGIAINRPTLFSHPCLHIHMIYSSLH